MVLDDDERQPQAGSPEYECAEELVRIMDDLADAQIVKDQISAQKKDANEEQKQKMVTKDAASLQFER